ncbi:hypothetical protein JYU34_000607 [Plutella xylostella]|uniref:Uncharacterized protein n=1 Tax=Plutella xylostella TaxID=51655 RepID=A0ABQ7R854_PLUXY|nr:hypothetical protein JYU34_000607 [Plutella xylostella]
MMGAKQPSLKLEIEIESGVEAGLLSDVDWFVLSGGTPRKDRGGRRISKSKSWRLIDLCTWIGMKGYESITALYTDGKGEEAKTIEKPKQENDSVNKDVQLMKKTLEDVVDRQDRLMRENEEMAMNMKKMMQKIEELENKLKSQSECRPPTSGRSLATGDCAASPPPPPPPHPPPPPPMPSSKLPVRSNTLPRCDSAPPRVAAPRLAITPQDIANVKLRKAKDNPNLRSKPNQNKQPLVTQQMLLSTRAGLGKKKHVSAATTQQQLSDLEKDVCNIHVQTSCGQNDVQEYRRAASAAVPPLKIPEISTIELYTSDTT